jgi:uncharacterized protein (TIGR03067 family)
MLAKPASLLPLVFLLLAQNDGADQAKKDLKLLHGAWTMEALEVNGQDVDVGKLEGTVVTIDGEKYAVKLKAQTIACVIRLDASKDPREIDMVFEQPGAAEKVHKGIYKIDGDTLKIARGLNPEQARPNQFATWPGTNYFVVTWRRKAP